MLRCLITTVLLRIKHSVLCRSHADLLLEHTDEIGGDPQSDHLPDCLNRGVRVKKKLGGVFDPQLLQILHRADAVGLMEAADQMGGAVGILECQFL